MFSLQLFEDAVKIVLMPNATPKPKRKNCRILWVSCIPAVQVSPSKSFESSKTFIVTSKHQVRKTFSCYLDNFETETMFYLSCTMIIDVHMKPVEWDLQPGFTQPQEIHPQANFIELLKTHTSAKHRKFFLSRKRLPAEIRLHLPCCDWYPADCLL